MTKKNDKYALHAKRRLRVNGENFTVSPYARDNEVDHIKDRAKMIEELKKSNDLEDKEILSILLEGYQKEQKVEKFVLKKKGLI